MGWPNALRSPHSIYFSDSASHVVRFLLLSTQERAAACAAGQIFASEIALDGMPLWN
jgi:hypothetical protein